MNVIRMENAKVRPISRGRGRGKGRDQRINRAHIEEPIVHRVFVPKYQSSSSEISQPLINGIPSSSSARTPSRTRRGTGITSSSSARMRSSSSTNVHQTTSTSVSAIDSTVIMAITSGRGDARCEVGMAAIDVKYPHLIMSQISDSQTYVNTLTKIHLFNPTEIIMPETMCGENPRNKLFNTIKSKFERIHITPIWRTHFNEENGLDRIKTHCSSEFSTIELVVKEKYYALATTAALLKYVEHIQHIVYEPKSMKIEFQTSQGATLIDVESAICLELVSSQGPQKNHSLFSSLDRCVTPMGRRLLRSSILQPPCVEDVIIKRQICVSELVRNRNLHTILQPIVKQLFGADRLLGLSMRAAFVNECVEAAERNLNYVLLLKTSLEIIPQLSSALDIATSPNLIKIRENLKDSRFNKIKDQILEIIQSDARSVNGYTSANMQRCFALKDGMNDMLDVARQTYCELIDQTRIVVESLAKEHKLPLTIGCNASLGYHIQMDIPKRSTFKIDDLPDIFMEVQKKRNSLYMTTDLLMALSQQCQDARDELHIMSNCILETLISSVRQHIGCLFQLSEDIAELDLVMSLARISAIPDYVKPKFGQTLRVIDSKHPILDILGTELPRANDIEASIAYNFHNITGPNMSGKTTYLKQVVLLNIMAQVGCYLPASDANIRIADRIFCILCPSHGDIESNASSFVQEIKEIEYILQFVTPQSLIVLDEICRSTNVEEGAALAFAICERLLDTSAFIFNCTHFIYLTKLTELYHNVVNQFFECVPNELDKWGLKYTYKLRNGVTCVENYGISAASAARMPKPVIDNAKELVKEIAKNIKPPPLVQTPEISWEKECYACVSKILELIITKEYTVENVQIATQLLQNSTNFQFPQKKNSSVKSKILQQNSQEKSVKLLPTQKITNLFENNARPSNLLENNVAVSNTLNNNTEFPALQISTDALKLHQINAEAGNFNVYQIDSVASNIVQTSASSKITQINLTNSNNAHQYNNYQSDLHKSNHQSSIEQYINQSNIYQSNYHSDIDQSSHQSVHHMISDSEIPRLNIESIVQQNIVVSEQPDQNFVFKMPILINPISSFSNNMEQCKRIDSLELTESLKTDISNFAFFKQKNSSSIRSSFQKLRPINKSLSGSQNSSLYEFGFSKKKVDPKKCPLDQNDLQRSDSQDNSDRSNLSNLNPQNSNLSQLSFPKETNSHTISSHSRSSKRTWQPNQDTKSSQLQNLDSASVSSKKSKLVIDGEDNKGASVFSTISKITKSLSSFNSENLSQSLRIDKSEKSAIQDSNSSSGLKLKNKEIEVSGERNENIDKISTFKNNNSDIESLLYKDSQHDSLKYDISEVSSLKEEIEVVTISSVDTLEAVDNIRRKEEEIFSHIEKNADDEKTFFQRLFNNPLSLEFSDELCSCSSDSEQKIE